MSKYDDIINIKYPFSKKHKKMSLLSRAGQFAAFAALTGFDDEIKEIERYTDDEIYIMEDKNNDINQKLIYLMQNKDVFATYYYFIKDKKKKGGSINKKTGNIYKIDIDNRKIIFVDKSFIIIDDIKDIQY